ncbi:putative transposase [Escherichia coli 90.0091]|nr:putative transposase [Escherichia coli 90.0091]
MLPSETMIWQPEFTDKTLSRKPGAVQYIVPDKALMSLTDADYQAI